MHPIHVDLELLIRYLAGEATPPDVEAVDGWLEADPAHAETLWVLRQVLGVGPQLVPQPDIDGAWRTLESRLADAEHPVRLVREWPLAGRVGVWRPVAAAASLLLLAGGATAWWYASARQMNQAVEAPTPVVATPRGQRLSVRLSDGTFVMLAPGSTLHLSPTYGARDRRLRLEGEAAFTVTHDSARPFVVATAYGETRDLGTRFVVRAYPGDLTEHVAVAEGRVAVTTVQGTATPSPANRLVLDRSDVARLSGGGSVTRVAGAALDSYFAWTEGRLVFRDAPLRDVAAQLARWYDVDVRLGSAALASLPLTASFAEQPADEALRLIAAILDLDLSRAGRVYTLRPR